MNFPAYFLSLFEDVGKGNIGGILMLAAYVLILLLVIIGAAKGARRGILRQTVRVLTIVVSAFLAYYLCTSVLYSRLSAFCEGKDMMEILTAFGLDGFVSKLDPNLVALLEGMDAAAAYDIGLLPLAMVVMPILFVLLFIVISALMLIVHGIVSGALGFFKSRTNAVTRLLGFVLGLAQGLAVAVLVMGPIAGMLTFSKQLAESFPEETNREENAYLVFYDQYAKYAADTWLTVTLDRYGGGFLYGKLSTVAPEGEELADLRESTRTLVEVYAETGALQGADWMRLTEVQEEAVRRISAKVGNDPYASRALSGLFRALADAADATADSETGLIPFEEPFRGLALRFVALLHDTTPETLPDDLSVLTDVYLRLNACGALVAFVGDGDPTACLLSVGTDDKTAISYITDRLGGYSRTAYLVTDLTQFAMTLLSDTLPFDENIVETYQQVKEDLATQVLGLNRDDYGTAEEYVADMEQGLNAIFTDVGLQVDTEIAHEMAVLIAEDPTFDDFDPSTVTDAEINDILLSYYTAYQNINP